jgi:S1-C subfamily serine protease
VRRDGREIDYVYPQSAALTFVTADSISMQVRPSPVEMNLNTTRGWLGLALDCLRCTVDRVDRTAHDSSLRFTTPPRVVAVEPGAAEQAGFRRGDVIRSIDGFPMISAEGARRFSSMRAGERVNFVVERGKDLVDLRLLVPRPL